MNYTLWIDNQAAGPFDVCQLTELFLSGAITSDTQIRLDNGEQTESWKTLGDTFPSISTLSTRSDTMQILSAEIRSTKVPLSRHPQSVSVTDIDMPFWSMVGFMIKWAIAAIPAAMLLSVIFGLLFLLATVLFGGLLAGFAR
jgi:hypothetical protein